jgi:hypothetical protein
MKTASFTREELLHMALKRPQDMQRFATDIRAFRARVARQDVNEFMEFVFVDDRTQNPIIQAPVHAKFQRLAEQKKRLIIWSHVSAGKTSQLAVGRTLYMLGKDPNLRIAIAGSAQGAAAKVLHQISINIEQNKNLHEVFPNLRPGKLWTSRAITVQRQSTAKDPSIQVTSVGTGAITGARIDHFIFDDILTYENTRTPANREHVQDWYGSSAISGRLTDGGSILFVGNAYHPEDLMHTLAANKAVWHAEKFPVLDSSGQSTSPLWTAARIAQKRLECTPDEFARQMLCQARDDASGRFRREWIAACLRRGEGKQLAYALAGLPAGYRAYTGVDLGVRKKAGSDLTVLFTIVVHPNEDREVVCIESGRWAAHEIVDRIIDTHRRFNSIIVVESNCLLPGSRVLTQEGYRPIEEVRVGDQVLTHKGRWRAVTATMSKHYKGKVHAWRARGSLLLETTGEHKALVRESGRVLGSRTAPDVGKHRPCGETKWLPVKELRAGGNRHAHYACVPIPIWPEQPPYIVLRQYDDESLVRVDEDLALFIGLFLAEGSKTRAQLQFSLHECEAYIADFIEAQASALGYRATRRIVNKRTLCVTVNSTALARAFDIGPSTRKCLPWSWMGWPLDLRLAIVRGWLVGDGCLARTPAGRVFRGCTTSRNLLLQMRATLLEAGFRPSIRRSAIRASVIEGRTVKRNPIYELALNIDDTRRLLDCAQSHMESLRWANAFAEPSKQSPSAVCFDDAGVAWSKVTQNNARNYEGPVFDLEVEEDHSFVVEDVAVHNSAQHYIKDFTNNVSSVPVVPFNTGANKHHYEFGIEGLATEISNAKWIIPSEAGRAHPEIEAWISDLLYYDPTAHAGDRLMGSWFAREGARASTTQRRRGRTGTIDTMSR